MHAVIGYCISQSLWICMNVITLFYKGLFGALIRVFWFFNRTESNIWWSWYRSGFYCRPDLESRKWMINIIPPLTRFIYHPFMRHVHIQLWPCFNYVYINIKGILGNVYIYPNISNSPNPISANQSNSNQSSQTTTTPS